MQGIGLMLKVLELKYDNPQITFEFSINQSYKLVFFTLTSFSKFLKSAFEDLKFCNSLVGDSWL